MKDGVTKMRNEGEVSTRPKLLVRSFEENDGDPSGMVENWKRIWRSRAMNEVVSRTDGVRRGEG